MKLTQFLVETKNASLSDVYPDFDLPADAKVLPALYKEFNKKYFGNKLPQKIRMKFAPLAKNFAGKAHFKYDKNGKISDILITLATMFKNDRQEIVDTVLHEMIHVWQRMEAERTGNSSFLDVSFWERGEENLKGHGKHFKQQMDRLNQYGFNIDLLTDRGMGIELTQPLYGILFSTDANISVILYTNTDPSEKLDSIIKEIEALMGNGFYNDVHVIKTTDNLIMQTTRLTKQFKLPKNQINITYKAEAVNMLLDSSYTEVIINQKPLEDEKSTALTAIKKDVPQEVIQLLPRIHKYRNSSFDNYWGTVRLNHPAWKRLKRDETQKMEQEDAGMKAAKELTKKDWMEVADIEVKRGFSGLDHGISSALKDGKLRDMDIKNIKYEFTSKYEERMDWARFRKLLVDATVMQMKKFIKKYKITAEKAGLTADALEMVVNKIYENSGI